jgi:hypothetical protein
MAQCNDVFDITLSIEESAEACEAAMQAMGWGLMQQAGPQFLVGEISVTFSGEAIWASAFSTSLLITLTSKTESRTTVKLEGQKREVPLVGGGALQNEMRNFRAYVEKAAKQIERDRQGQPGQMVSELEALAKMHQQGLLSDEEFQQAKAKVIRKQHV